jgi:hypothetical protein
MALKSRAQVASCALEFAHDLPNIPRQFRQFLWPEYHKGDDKHDN